MRSIRSTHLLSLALVLSLAHGCSSEDDGSGSGSTGSDGSSGTGGSSGGTGDDGGTGDGGTGGDDGTGDDGGTDSTEGPPPDCPNTSELEVELLDTTAISEMGVPFDADVDDLQGPYGWSTNYGKPPEIIAVPSGDELAILWQDHTEPDPRQAFVIRVEKVGDSYEVTRAFRVELLARIMGLARDDEENYYYATGVDEGESITVDDPAPGEHRSDIVRIVKFDRWGCPQLEVDVDPAREAAEAESEAVINPMVAATSRLAHANGRLVLVHGINTDPDDNDVRHQKALTTHIDANTGTVTRTSTMWVSHSFDQRVLWDGEGFVELHLGDAYPRAVALGRFFDETEETDTYRLFRPKGPTGDNSTYTRLGGIAQATSGDFGYMVVFVTDRSASLPTGDWSTIEGTRDLALVRVRRGFASMDPEGTGFIDTSVSTQTVESGGQTVTNHLQWLTDYGQGGANDVHADRPRIAAVGDDLFVVLWERWEQAGDDSHHTGTWALVLDASGAIIEPATRIGDAHIPRGDDMVTFDGQAVVVTGSEASRSLTLSLLSGTLETREVVLP